MRPLDTAYIGVYATDADGVALEGLDAGDFTFPAAQDGASLSLAVASCLPITGCPGGYQLGVVMPAVAGWISIYPQVAGGVVSPRCTNVELQTQDIPSLLAALAQSNASLVDGATNYRAADLTLGAKRYTPVDIIWTGPEDFSAWTNIRFTVRNSRHTDTPYAITLSNPGAPVDGVTIFSFIIPEDAALFSEVDAAITAGTMPIRKTFDIIGDEGGDAAHTRQILAGNIVIASYVGAP